MTQPVQTVVYRFDPAHDPAWQFYSMPESIVGGGTTLDEAQHEYRDALQFSLDTDTLPEVREYIEREIGKLGIWMRLPIDHPNFDEVATQVGRQIEAHPDDRHWFLSNTTAGGSPVIVTAPVTEPLSSILNQMTVFDSLILAMLHRPTSGPLQNVWLVIAGAATASANAESLTSFEALGLTADSPLRDLLKAALARQINTISALARC
ncbi:Uncharacterised protein [Mycobacteroides abscessus subsp. abscessus]|uniref:hypothetical protein n=1 Tax=Mycobacteroides abscessus TaxID=36809 RepID=UPI00092B75A8|nr:hypothetical protein [Mycobacteroides abscessus]MDM2078754.1 hypothetical protein [Mycobacteroides abscessus]MDM2087458.1 hypothetical protein [Mycobacteroides abscessus]SHP82446.1 Uncharacterised protein [Mycobacteroides abscessus subsp. abscessus]SHQ13257.1 Uncharacterised protein [Mycobacteroides abscessus subsp. abscessus]SHQ26424.1 Uncharacterised protein [Mycobacteroides abscessus subsp. abscessus]